MGLLSGIKSHTIKKTIPCITVECGDDKKLFIETTIDNINVKVPECATSGMAESILYEVGRQMVPLSPSSTVGL